MDFPVTEAQTKRPRMKGTHSLLPLKFTQQIFDILRSVQIILSICPIDDTQPPTMTKIIKISKAFPELTTHVNLLLPSSTTFP